MYICECVCVCVCVCVCICVYVIDNFSVFRFMSIDEQHVNIVSVYSPAECLLFFSRAVSVHIVCICLCICLENKYYHY